MQKLLENIAGILVIIFMMAGITYFVSKAFDKVERATCYTWQDYEKHYPLYETHPDTALRCLALGVDVHEDY